MGKIVETITSLVIQYANGFTKTGRVAHKSFTISYLRNDVTEAEARAFIAVLRPAMASEITGVRLVTKKRTVVWTPEVKIAKKKRENEEEMMNSNQNQNQTRHVAQQSVSSVSNGVSAQVAHTSTATTAPVNQVSTAAPVMGEAAPVIPVKEVNASSPVSLRSAIKNYGAKLIKKRDYSMKKWKDEALVRGEKERAEMVKARLEREKAESKPMTTEEIYQACIAAKPPVAVPTPTWVSPVAQLQARYDAERAEQKAAAIAAEESVAVSAANTANAASTANTTEEVPDLSHMVEGWDWNKSRPWQTEEEAKLSPDFVTRTRANGYQITENELDQLLSASPHDCKNSTAYQQHLKPFEDLDPLIYGDPDQQTL